MQLEPIRKVNLVGESVYIEKNKELKVIDSRYFLPEFFCKDENPSQKSTENYLADLCKSIGLLMASLVLRDSSPLKFDTENIDQISKDTLKRIEEKHEIISNSNF